jgi:TolB protein
MVLLQSRSSLGCMSQGPALLFRKHVTRRGAVALAVLSLSGAFAIPQAGRGAPAKLIHIIAPDLTASFDDSGNIGRMIANLILDDLRGSRQFAPIPWTTLATVDKTYTSPSTVPQFDELRKIGAQVLVTGRIDLAEDGKLKFKFYVWDVQAGVALMMQQLVVQADDWRKAGHFMSSAIYKLCTAETRDFE